MFGFGLIYFWQDDIMGCWVFKLLCLLKSGQVCFITLGPKKMPDPNWGRVLSYITPVLICTYWLSGRAGWENIWLKVRTYRRSAERSMCSDGWLLWAFHHMTNWTLCRNQIVLHCFCGAVCIISSRAVRVFPALSLRRIRLSHRNFFLMVFQGNCLLDRTGDMIMLII